MEYLLNEFAAHTVGANLTVLAAVIVATCAAYIFAESSK